MPGGGGNAADEVAEVDDSPVPPNVLTAPEQKEPPAETMDANGDGTTLRSVQLAGVMVCALATGSSM